MQLINEFDVPLPPTETWTLLTDLEKVAPCLPGASITSVEGDQYHGRAKIKVGPITAEYKGVAHFAQLDAEAGKAVLTARGKDAREQGDATATVTATLSPQAGGTRVSVETDLVLTGKVAQFGRGVLADVSGSLMNLFAERLREMVVAGGSAPSPAPSSETPPSSAPATTPDVGRVDAPEPTRPRTTRQDDEVLDVLSIAGSTSWAKTLEKSGPLVSILAALVSVFAAGYAAGRARSTGC